MLLRETKNWKEFLSYEDENRMNELLRKVGNYKAAYKNSDDVKMAQTWCAILELAKQNQILQKRMDRLDDVLNGAFEKIKKHDEEKRDLIKSLERF